MNGKKVTFEQLALYQDGLLRDTELREVEAALAENPEYRATMEELKAAEFALQDWGRKNRIFNAVVADLKKDKIAQAQPAEESSWTFLFSPQWAGSFAAITALLLTAYLAYPIFATKTASVLVAFGDVRQMSKAIEDGAALSIGRQIELGSDGYAAIRMADGRSVAEFGPNTVAVVTGERQLTVNQGVVFNTVAKDPDHPYEITTPQGKVVVLGTKFEVEVNETQSTIRVQEGAVRIQSAETESANAVVSKGFTGSITRNAVVQPRELAGARVAPWRKIPSQGLDTKGMAKINDRMTGQNR